MPFDEKVTYEQAEKAREARLSVGKSRRVPQFLGMIEDLKKTAFHIFNVGPWSRTVHTGSTGSFVIPACPDDKDYIEMLREVPDGHGGLKLIAPITAIMDELVIKNESEYDRLIDDGWKFALELVGDGRGNSQQNSLRHYGIFPSKNAEPNADELYQAHLMLNARCSELVQEARNLFAMDRKTFNQCVNRGTEHYMAADVLGLTNEPWMVSQQPQSLIKCPFCKASVQHDAMKCTNCNEIIDEEAYAAARTRQKKVLGSDEAAPASESRRRGRKPKQ